jgi:uncharacterized protein (TIGR02145 family)
MISPKVVATWLIFSFLLGCGTGNEPTFELITTVSPAGSGTILPSKTTFNKGETAVLEAVPNLGWDFVRWEGDITSLVNPANLGMTRDYNIIGVFQRADIYETGPLTDIDGNVYKTFQIGSQNWMAANLKTTRYRDGSVIPNVTNATTWAGLETGAWVNYNNDAANDAIYGKLYNWLAVATSAGLCPTGWHVPTDSEWTVLSNFLAGDVGFKMKSTSGWADNGNGSNESGFNGLPGGYRSWSRGRFDDVGRSGVFWSSSELIPGSVYVWYRYLNYGFALNSEHSAGKRTGFSVRCLRD